MNCGNKRVGKDIPVLISAAEGEGWRDCCKRKFYFRSSSPVRPPYLQDSKVCHSALSTVHYVYNYGTANSVIFMVFLFSSAL